MKNLEIFVKIFTWISTFCIIGWVYLQIPENGIGWYLIKDYNLLTRILVPLILLPFIGIILFSTGRFEYPQYHFGVIAIVFVTSVLAIIWGIIGFLISAGIWGVDNFLVVLFFGLFFGYGSFAGFCFGSILFSTNKLENKKILDIIKK